MIRELDLEELSLYEFNELAKPLGLPRIRSANSEHGVMRFFKTTTQTSYDDVGALVADIEDDKSYRISSLGYDVTSKKKASSGKVRSKFGEYFFDATDKIKRIIANQDSYDFLTVWTQRTDIPWRKQEVNKSETTIYRKIGEKWHRVGLSIPGQNFSLYTFNGIEPQPNRFQVPLVNVVYVPPQGLR